MKEDFPTGDEKLKYLLRKSRPEPTLPARFQESVWLRLSESKATEPTASFTWLDRWLERFLLPRFAVASIALLLIAGGLTGIATANTTVKQRALEKYLSVVAPNSIR